MDPYLEGPLWPSFHTQLCAEIARQLTPALGPRYIALVEGRLVVEAVDDFTTARRAITPDVTVAGEQPVSGGGIAVREPPLRLAAAMEVEVPQHFVEVREIPSMVVVTVIEVLSPANKTGEGRSDYLRKRRAVLNSDAHLIEIDLLRGGARPPMRDPLPDYPYFALIHRASQRPMADTWPVGLRDRLPSIDVPLLPPDADAILDLQAAFDGAYDSVGYGRVLDRSRTLDPRLAADDEAWVRSVVARTLK